MTLVERVAQPRAIGAGIAIAANGLAVLEALGLGLPQGQPVSAGRITDAAGRTLLAPRGHAPRVVLVRRSTLQGVLHDAIAADDRIDLKFGTELLDATPAGAVTLRQDGEESTHRADLVVGADGLHSRVRQCGDFGAQVRSSGIRYVRMLVTANVATGTEAWTPAGLFGAFAVDGGTYAFASCGTPESSAALDARDLDAFRRHWAANYPPAGRILGAVSAFDDLIVNEVFSVDCARWFDAALVLVGDAAHAMAPNLGQGANSALVDAAVLFDELRRAPSLPAGLTAYQQRRRPAVQRVAQASAQMGRLAEMTNPMGRLLRDRVLLQVAGMLASPKSVGMLLQEPTAVLRGIAQ